MRVRYELRFVLNDKPVVLEQVPAMMTLLDYLRLHRRLTGTKEGCAEGDCGACTVLVGRLQGHELAYEAVNACIRLMGSLDGCHVVTIEHLRGVDGGLHPIQEAMVERHASQCGFCTPGIVMSLYALWMRATQPSERDVEIALQGNLCRCTGYAPIIRAALMACARGGQNGDQLLQNRERIIERLRALKDGARVELGPDEVFIPASVDDLAQLRTRQPAATIIAGGTDAGLWVTKAMRQISPAIFIAHLEELQQIDRDDKGLKIGACVSLTQAMPLILKQFPQLRELLERFGGDQIRNMGTLGGNIANGSPVGDMPPVLMALGASLGMRRGGERRELPLAGFFLDYGRQDRREGDFLEYIRIPYLQEGDFFAAYKVSKRRDEDISSVCGAFKIRLCDGMIKEAVIAFGGMAGVPQCALKVAELMKGRSWSQETIEAAAAGLVDDFAPISDWRASAEYRLLVAQNLLRRMFLEQTLGAGQVRLPLMGVS